LVAVEGGEVPAQPLLDATLSADRIALARRLHLDDFRAHVAEKHGAKGAREHPGEIDHPNAVQRLAHLDRHPQAVATESMSLVRRRGPAFITCPGRLRPTTSSTRCATAVSFSRSMPVSMPHSCSR